MAETAATLEQPVVLEVERKRRWPTLLALGLGHFIDQGEGQVMSVLSPIIQTAFGLTFGQLGLITTLRNIAQTVSAPFWGYAADKWPRRKVLVFGTGIWGVWTLTIAFVATYDQLLLIRTISGLGLGCLMPATFSLLSDHFREQERGRALGAVGMLGFLGVVISVLALGFVATPALWRWGFFGLGLASVASGALIWLMVEEPPRGSAEKELADLITHENQAQFAINVADIFKAMRIPTIWVAIAQGITGTMPWVVLGFFFINWMTRVLGYRNEITLSEPAGSAPLIFAAIVVGSAISNMMGGLIGDWADRLNPKYGRTVIGQFSVWSGVPLSYLFLSRGTDFTFWQFFGLAFLTALLIGWAGKGAKEPMMAAVVPPELRSSAFSVVTVIEGGLSAFAGLIAGMLADRIGLTQALLWTVPFPWIICGVVFSAFYWTYPRDKARMHAILAEHRATLKQLEAEETR